MKCDRCNGPAPESTMSRFNTEIICIWCEAKEKVHPSYAEAKRIEHEHVVNGNYNFPGVGKPSDL